MGFSRRTLRRLERRGLSPCPECGLPPDGPGHIVVIDDGVPSESFPDAPEERCSRCDRPLWCVIHVLYGEEGEGVRADA